LAQPSLHTWTEAKPLPLLETEADKADPAPKALACYGVLLSDTGQRLLRFVQGRPVSQVTCDFLAWLAEQMTKQGKKALVLLWDNASWHKSQPVRTWLQAHKRTVKKAGGCRLLVCPLPSKSPWLNNIEPKWVHGKRALVEPDRKLTMAELKERLCAYYQCELLEPLAQQVT